MTYGYTQRTEWQCVVCGRLVTTYSWINDCPRCSTHPCAPAVRTTTPVVGREVGDWLIVRDEDQLATARAQCRGSFQRDLLAGRENLSGSTRANSCGYGGFYEKSIANLRFRCEAAGVEWSEARGPHNRRMLVIG